MCMLLGERRGRASGRAQAPAMLAAHHRASAYRSSVLYWYLPAWLVREETSAAPSLSRAVSSDSRRCAPWWRGIVWHGMAGITVFDSECCAGAPFRRPVRQQRPDATPAGLRGHAGTARTLSPERALLLQDIRTRRQQSAAAELSRKHVPSATSRWCGWARKS